MWYLSHIELATKEDKQWRIDYWASLFKAKTWEDLRMIAQRDEYMAEAAETMYELSADEAIRQRCLARQDYYRTQNTYKKAIADLTAENKRITEEKERITEEKERITLENKRITGEKERITLENKRITEENKRITEEKERITQEKQAISDTLNAEIDRLMQLLVKNGIRTDETHNNPLNH